MTKRSLEKVAAYIQIIPSFVLILFRMMGVFLKFRSASRKSSKYFEKGLIDKGMTKEQAKEIAKVYKRGRD